MSAGEVRLVHFKVRNYRSCRNTQFSPNKGVTALIGPNGAGKTNLLQALMLIGITGTRLRRASRPTEDAYTRKCTIDANFVAADIPASIRATITYRPPDERGEQIVAIEERWQFRDPEGSTEWLSALDIVRVLSASKDRNLDDVYQLAFDYLSIEEKRQILVERRTAPPAETTFSKERTTAYAAIQRFRAGIKYYSASQFTNPAAYPIFFEIDEKGTLANEYPWSTPQPHARFIFDLYSLSKSKQTVYDQYISLINDDGVGLIRSINWREVTFGSRVYQVHAGGRVVSKRQPRIMIVPTVKIGYSELSFNQLSEGTLRALAILFYIVADGSELLLLEEPEVCVHHGLLNSVIRIIKEYARSKQIIFSTHSEVAIDALTPEEVLLVDKPKNRGTIATSIPDKMSKDGYAALKTYLATTGSLGDYWRELGFIP